VEQPQTEEEFLFVEAYKRNIHEMEKNDKRLEEEVRLNKECNRRSSAIGITLDNNGRDVDISNFMNAAEHERFLTEAKEEESNFEVLMSLSPHKSRGGRRVTTSHMLVESICKHVRAAFVEIGGDDNISLSINQFASLMERMAFLGVDSNGNNCEGDQVIFSDLWDLYSERDGSGSGVSLENCQRLLLQVLAGLEVKKSLGTKISPTNNDQKLEKKEQQLVNKVSALYNERRLLQKPRHHRHLEDKNGLLTDSTIHQQKKHPPPLTNANTSLKTPAHVSGKKTPSFGTRRRASTYTSRIRKDTTRDAKKDLESHYACTFQPKINNYSRKLDAKSTRAQNVKGKPTTTLLGEGRSGTHNLDMESLSSASKYLDKVMRSEDKFICINDFRAAFDKVLQANEGDTKVKERVTSTVVLLTRALKLAGRSGGQKVDKTTKVDSQKIYDSLMKFISNSIMQSNRNHDHNTSFDSATGGGLDQTYISDEIPESLAVRLEKWQRWNVKREVWKKAERDKKVADEVKGCTFKPKLNKVTKKIIKGGSAATPVSREVSERLGHQLHISRHFLTSRFFSEIGGATSQGWRGMEQKKSCQTAREGERGS